MACKACVTIPPVESDYQAKGTHEKVGDLDIYLAGEPSELGIVYLPDIFGPTPQAFQVSDKFGAAGFLVGFPEVFRGDAWPLSKFPPSDRDELMKWIGKYDYEGKVKPDIDATVNLLKEKGAKKFAIVGFCWGGKMSTKASADPTFSASASAHPSFVSTEDAATVACSILLLPSKDEADLTGFIDAVKAKGIEASQTRYDDMHHGWVAARGDWNVPEQKKRATEAIQQIADFFKTHLG